MKKWPWFLLSVCIVLLDQASKYWAVTTLSLFEPQHVLPVLNFTLAYNTGAAFSFLSAAGAWHQWFFIGFSAVMSIILTIWMLRSAPSAHLLLMALALILGGAVGNLIDRILLGHVIDFIDVYYNNYHWPVFNLADSAICVGAGLLIVDLIKNP